jgi:hypothetical protein
LAHLWVKLQPPFCARVQSVRLVDNADVLRVQFAINNAMNAATKMAPFVFAFGRRTGVAAIDDAELPALVVTTTSTIEGEALQLDFEPLAADGCTVAEDHADSGHVDDGDAVARLAGCGKRAVVDVSEPIDDDEASEQHAEVWCVSLTARRYRLTLDDCISFVLGRRVADQARQDEFDDNVAAFDARHDASVSFRIQVHPLVRASCCCVV